MGPLTGSGHCQGLGRDSSNCLYGHMFLFKFYKIFKLQSVSFHSDFLCPFPLEQGGGTGEATAFLRSCYGEVQSVTFNFGIVRYLFRSLQCIVK